MAGEHRPPAHTLTHSPYQGSPLLQKNRSRSKKPIPSQARKRESSAPKPVARPWIPAGAGMTATERSENPNDIALPLKGGEGQKSKTAGNSPEMCPPDRGWGGGDTARRYVKTSGNPEARRSVFNASSSSFTTMEARRRRRTAAWR